MSSSEGPSLGMGSGSGSGSPFNQFSSSSNATKEFFESLGVFVRLSEAA